MLCDGKPHILLWPQLPTVYIQTDYKFPWVVYSYEFLLKYPELVPCHFYDGIDNLCELAKLLIINSYLPLAYRS